MMLRIVMYSRGRGKIFCLPDVEKDAITAAAPSYEKYQVTFVAMDHQWYAVKPEEMTWNDGEDTRERCLHHEMSLILKHEDAMIGIYCSEILQEDVRFGKYVLTGETLKIGRHEDCGVCSPDKRLSNHHGVLKVSGDHASYADTSKNGSFINGLFIRNEEKEIRTGDLIAFASGLQIVYLGGNVIGVSGIGGGHVALQAASIPHIVTFRAKAAPLYRDIARPPRFMPKIEEKKYEIEATPVLEENRTQPLLLSMGPALTMSLPMLLGSMLTGSSYRGYGTVMMVSSSVLAVGWSLMNYCYSRHMRKKQFKEAMADYIKRLGRTEKEINKGVEEILNTLEKYYPAWQQCCSDAAQLSSAVWERTPNSETFLKIRIGRGQVRLPYSISVPKLKMGEVPEDEKNAPYRLQEKFSMLHDAPITVDLLNDKLFGIVSAEASSLIETLILQLSVMHAPEDVRIALIAKPGNGEKWRFLRALPHMQLYDGSEGQLISDNYADAMEILSQLNDVLMLRLEKDNEKSAMLPHYIVIFEDNTYLWRHVLFSNIIASNAGFSICVCAEKEEELPKECKVVYNAREKKLYNYAEKTTQSVTPESCEESQFWQTIDTLNGCRETGLIGNRKIPDRVTFLEMYGVRETEQLGIRLRWEQNSTSRDIIAYLGKMAGERIFPLDLSDKQHGPHGIMAGTTGSGKSVLLQTLLLSLALNYSPEQMQFILIDYKGGGTFNNFRNMPHCIGFVDNLQGKRSINRALYSLRGEVKRRERLFKRYDVDNIDAYIRYVNPLADSRKLSHILIVIDEFSELMDELPDFMSELISTARVGRSVGLHLLLATQRPSNKVGPEIWSNSRFHICLQVRTREDSNDMLHRPDAAFIKGNGRGFVQVGNDELFEQIQTAYCGAAYEPEQGDPAAKPALMDSLGRRKKMVAAANAPTKKAKSQMSAVLDEINRTAETYGYQGAGKLWLPELPNVIDLTALPSAEENTEDGISAVIGMLDDVANQRYLTASLNVSALRNMAIIGHSQSGKTMFLQTLAYAVSRRYSPAQVQMMVLSFSGTALKSIETIPNVCDVLTKWESREERAAYYRLEELMTARDATFAEKKTDSFASYNRACEEDGEPVMPALIVAVDRFAQWYELLNDNEQEKVENLIKTASGRGVYFIVTANAMGEINRRLLEAMQVIPLGMGSASEYADALNVRTSSIQAIPADLPGRGVMNSKQGCLEFQTGLAFGLAEDRKRAEKLHEYGEALPPCSAPVLKMPRVPAEFGAQVLAAYGVKEKKAEVPVAFRHESLKPVFLDFYEKPTVLVAGKRETGKTSLLMSLAKLCAGDDGDIFVIASESDQARWKTVNGHVAFLSSNTPVDRQRGFTSDMDDRFGEQKRAQRAVSGWEDENNWRAIAGTMKPLCIVLDDVDRWFDGEKVDQQLSKQLLTAVRLGSKYSIRVLISTQLNANSLPDSVRAFAQNCHIITTGNTLSSFDPWNCSLTYDRTNEYMKPGEGFVIPENRFPIKVYLPKE